MTEHFALIYADLSEEAIGRVDGIGLLMRSSFVSWTKGITDDVKVLASSFNGDCFVT